MAEVIRMPLLSDTMTEGKIAAWLKNVGDVVTNDDVLAEVETDKATMEVMGYADGVLLYIGVPAGEAAKINEIIAIVGKPGEDISSYLNEAKPSSNPIKPVEQVLEIAPKVTTVAPAAALPKELTVITMPLLSDTMKEGKIASWLKNIGDAVTEDDVIAEVETDKATMEVIGYAKGTLLYQGAIAGEAVLVNGTMAVVGPANFDLAPYTEIIKKGASASEKTKEAAIAAPASASSIAASNNVATENITSSDTRIKASPLAKKMAQEKGISLSQLSGSGDGGRIIMRDVVSAPITKSETAAPLASAPNLSLPTPAATINIGVEGFSDTPLSQMRQIIAQRLSDSMFTAPHFYLKTTIAMDTLLAIRKNINEAQPIKISINDILIKAVAMSLRQHPDINSSFLGDKIRTYSHINIGTAIALPDGLIVPVLKFADTKSLSQIATEANTLYERARARKIQPAEFTGNTFTISNLGMMDIDEFTAIINPPDACILAVGKSTPTPVVDDKGNIVVKTLMKLTLSCDHRVVDGAVGAAFLKTLKGFLENPVAMMV
jgi:pyruvate dehydrogenase E2 component (dihydrolipoamide acetyltransferase)